MVELGLVFFTCILLLVPSVKTAHHELRRELASVKELVAGIERKLDSLVAADSGFQNVELSLNSLMNKVTDLNRKSQLLSEIHQDNANRKDVLQRISRSLEEISRKQAIYQKNEAEIERLDKLSEHVQALFQIFGGMNRKLDDLQTRVERLPTNDLFLTKKIDTASDCMDKESLKAVLHSLVKHPLEKVVQKCSALEELLLVQHDPPQEPKETPGRIFRKLWRKMTEPINRVGDRIEALTQTLELSNERHHNATIAKLREWSGRTCPKQMQVLQNATRETAQRLRSMEASQMAVQNVCTQILSASQGVPGVTEAYQDTALTCAHLQQQGATRTGVYTIQPKEVAFKTYCDLETEGGGWTVIQRRGDFGGDLRQNFTQNWELYKNGFGDPQREFWIGNEKLHWLTTMEDVKLRIELQDFDDNTAHAEYSRFLVEDESKQYRLSVGGYLGNATDSLSLHDQKMFSTYDRDNDEVASCCNCADTFKGGWWYYRCFEANLNGPYHSEPTENGYFLGIIWERWKGDYSLKSSEMKIRPLSFEEKDP